MEGPNVESVANIFGTGGPVIGKPALAGMKSIESQMRTQFARSRRSFERRVGQERALLNQLAKSPAMPRKTWEPATATFRTGLMRDFLRAQESCVRKTPKPRRTSSIASGDPFANRVPPYDFAWTLGNGTGLGSGGPRITEGALLDTGQMWFEVWTNALRLSQGSAGAAIGIYYRPVPGPLVYTYAYAMASVTAHYGTWDLGVPAHTQGQVGLSVMAYKLSNNAFDGLVTAETTRLWTVDSETRGIGDYIGSSQKVIMSALFVPDASHWYQIWMTCMGAASASGTVKPFMFSVAHSGLDLVNVDGMGWIQDTVIP